MVRDSCLWDSGRWEWWEIILGWIPLKFRGIWSYRISNTLIFFLFPQYSMPLMHAWWFMAHGSRLMAHGQGRPGEAHARLWVPRAGPAPGHEPWASPGLPWPWAMSLQPWDMNHQACIKGIEYWENYCLWGFVRSDVAIIRGDESHNYSPPFPPTRIPCLLIPDHLYVRFLDFPVLHLLTICFRFLALFQIWKSENQVSLTSAQYAHSRHQASP